MSDEMNCPLPSCPMGGKPCQSDEGRERVKMQQLGRTLLRELRRIDLNYREYQLAELLVEMSYGWGLKSLVVPKLEVWSQLTGVAKPHVHKYLNQLVEIGVITVEPTDHGPRYAINPHIQGWRCRLKVSRSQIKDALNTIKMFNGMDDPDFFEFHLGSQIPLFRITESGTVTQEDMP